MSGSSTRLTRQGVRDLGGGRQRKQVAVVCRHVWEEEVLPVYDYWGDEPLRRVRRCGYCGAVQS